MSTSGGVRADSEAVAHLNGAAIATLFSAPTLIVPSPGAAGGLVVTELVAEFVPGVIGYALGGGALSLYYSGGVPIATRRAAGTLAGNLTAGPPTHNIGTQVGRNQVWLASLIENRSLSVGDITANPTPSGPIVTTTLDAGGAAYAIGDTGTVDGNAYGAAAAYVVDTVDGLGAVLTYHLSAAGDGYTTGANPRTTTDAGAQPGIGVGFQVNVTALPPNDGDLYVTAFYSLLALH